MQFIDRYELTLAGHMRLVDARSALNYFERFIDNPDAVLDRDAIAVQLEPLVEALNDAADETRPIDGADAFRRQACEWNYIALSPEERVVLQQIRSCNAEGQQDIFRVIRETLDNKPVLDPN